MSICIYFYIFIHIVKAPLKAIKELCKANQIKLSRIIDGKRVAYKKSELITKLKRKKIRIP
jgi:hypothetical protein